jgi:hypothetical protein
MEDAWDDFLKIYRDAKPFKNRGWIHLEKMTIIMPATIKGTHVFRPSQGLSGLTSFHNYDEDMPPYSANTQEEEDEGASPVIAAPAAIVVRLFHCFNT